LNQLIAVEIDNIGPITDFSVLSFYRGSCPAQFSGK